MENQWFYVKSVKHVFLFLLKRSQEVIDVDLNLLLIVTSDLTLIHIQSSKYEIYWICFCRDQYPLVQGRFRGLNLVFAKKENKKMLRLKKERKVKERCRGRGEKSCGYGENKSHVFSFIIFHFLPIFVSVQLSLHIFF